VDRLEAARVIPQIYKSADSRQSILTAEDAKECVEHGWDGIIVSNHGGRSNDYTPSTLEVLTEIVDAVQGRVPVVIDSGFRRGSDVLKAFGAGSQGRLFGPIDALRPAHTAPPARGAFSRSCRANWWRRWRRPDAPHSRLSIEAW